MPIPAIPLAVAAAKALPFLVKGAVVVGKALVANPAAAKGATVALKTAVGTFGSTATTTAVATGLVCIGGVAWTGENAKRAMDAYDYASEGDLASAAKELTAFAVSVKTVGTTEYTGHLQSWIDNGKPLDSSLLQLAQDGKALVDEAIKTGQLSLD